MKQAKGKIMMSRLYIDFINEKQYYTPTPWLTLLLVLAKSRVNQKLRYLGAKWNQLIKTEENSR